MQHITLPSAAREPATWIRAFGQRLERAWQSAAYDERVFPDLAGELLDDARPHDQWEGAQLLAWAAQAELPVQLDPFARFGNPPLTVFRGERFVVDLYAWFTSTTSIHQHGFSGAFCVLAGGSVHSRYSFRPRERINARLLLGEVAFEWAEILRRGDIRTILPGHAFIHALFHLEHPSITMVVRTVDDPDHAPQYSYLPPGVAFDPFYGVHRRRFEIFGALAQMDLARYREAAVAWFGETDLYGALLLMRAAHQHLAKHPEVLSELLDDLSRVFGRAGADVAAALREETRARQITTLRHAVKDPDDRFLLALLLNVPTGREILRLVAQHTLVPEGAAVEDVVSRWIARLSNETKLGFRLDETQTEVLRLMVQKLKAPEILEALKTTYDAEEVASQAAAVLKLTESLRAQQLLRPLFA